MWCCPLLGRRCVQDGWTAPHSPPPPWNSPQPLAVIRRMPRERFHVRLLTLTHTKATEVTQLPENQRASLMMFVIKQRTLHLLCFVHSMRALIPQGEPRWWNHWFTSATCCFDLFWALRGCAERPLTSVRGSIIGPVYFYCFISDASEVADGVL